MFHTGDTKSPYEQIYNKPPALDRLQPFGTVCYPFIPEEKRTKQENVRVRARLNGFGDDDDTTEIIGYKCLLESDLSILYSDDVIFDLNAPMVPLNERSAHLFYSDFIRIKRLEMKSTVTDKVVVATRQAIKDFYKATPKSKRDQALSELKTFSKKAFAAGREKRHCKTCEDAGKPERIYGSHNTVNHKESYRPNGQQNKDGNQCSSLLTNTATVYDTAANTHWFKDKPRHDYVPTDVLFTAANQTAPIVGERNEKIQELVLNKVQHTPSFTHNLVSGPTLMKDEYVAVLGNDRLHIKKGQVLYATGSYDNTDGVIKI